ncbi:hypothetical protein AcV7_009267 [Taiwanofungus camphoratus]|nr:hypothetical protein AcV7_009267 [Antrodia cinnamomea]
MTFYKHISNKIQLDNNAVYCISNETHQAVSAWFLGPKAENHKVLKDHLCDVVDRITRSRKDYFPNDPVFITDSIKGSDAYEREKNDLKAYLGMMTELLCRYSVPSFSPRYIGHMCFDNSMPATLGYITAMMHNPNNVAVEASPLTSYVEYCAGQQLCKMLGYNTAEDTKRPGIKYKGWGHITCDGSVANLESMWVARNLKFYPLSLKWAIEEGKLAFVASSFKVPLTKKDSGEVLFMEASDHDLLNLKSEVVLSIPDRLSQQFGISQQFLEEEISPYLVQSIGREPLEKRYGIAHTPQYLISKMNHYGWPKGAAIIGIGRSNVRLVDVDLFARMDIMKLEYELAKLVKGGHPIYAVVAIIGTTEHGAVDPLEEVLALRRKFEDDYGVSFLVHCDAAWGGYFASMLHPVPTGYKKNREIDDYVPTLALSPYTEAQLKCLKHADSITIDPHKSGYVPYPAGGLCYKDERAKFLITWTCPYINNGATDVVESMGTYGLEGSKPGASPVAAYISNEVIGLHKGGYGGLLGEAMFTSVKMYSHWVTMTLDSDTLIVAPLNMLPAEQDGKSQEDVEEQRKWIRKYITNRDNLKLVEDPEAMALVKRMGSDLSINAFACNFRLSKNGLPNRDVAEASYLNARIVDRLSITKNDDNAQEKPLVLMGTEFEEEKYGECLKIFKRRLQLNENDPTTMTGLCNVSMSPFPTAGNFVYDLAKAFRQVAEEEVQNCWKRINIVPSIHSFLMQGIDSLYLTYLPMFNVGSYRQQLIVSAKLKPDDMKKYAEAQKAKPDAIFTMHTSAQELLSSILENQRCIVDVQEGLPTIHGVQPANLLSEVELTDITILRHTSLAPRNLARNYPVFMPFYLYGTHNEQHIDHILLKDPNAQLSASRVKIELSSGSKLGSELPKGVIAVMDDIREHAMQPYGHGHHPDFFAVGRSYKVSIYVDPFDGQYGQAALDIHTMLDKLDLTEALAKGTITLGNSIYVNDAHLNRDTIPDLHITLPMEQLTRDVLLLSVTHDYEQIKHDIERLLGDINILAAQDVDKAIMAKVSLPGNYSFERASIAQSQPVARLSRFALPGSSDDHSRKLAVRQGWKDAFDRALVDHKLQSANASTI